MSLPPIVSRDEWRLARTALLGKEKALTRARDELNAERRRLPMVEIDKTYVFDGPDGKADLADLFEGRRQLIVHHFMFDPDGDEGCPSCTASADELSDGLLRHLAARRTTLATLSRAPLAKLSRYREARGWTFPWYSSFDSDFNHDFGVTLDPAVAPPEYNFRSAAEYEARGREGWVTDASFELPGFSCLLRDGDRIFHTYSAFARGMEARGGSYHLLDLTALGRQEDWEEPRDRNDETHPPAPSFRE
jgi:predicted dithiol-disulfide oxidoreductase (DUF899 family)